jgi:hypothetical protein
VGRLAATPDLVCRDTPRRTVIAMNHRMPPTMENRACRYDGQLLTHDLEDECREGVERWELVHPCPRPEVRPRLDQLREHGIRVSQGFRAPGSATAGACEVVCRRSFLEQPGGQRSAVEIVVSRGPRGALCGLHPNAGAISRAIVSSIAAL